MWGRGNQLKSLFARLAILASVATAVFVPVGPASATHGGPFGRLDVDCQPTGTAGFVSFWFGSEAIQTFTVNGTGKLLSAQATSTYRSAGGEPADVTMEIRTVDGAGEPTSTVVASTVIPDSEIPQDETTTLTGNFDPAPFVHDGERYALVIRSDDDAQNSWNYWGGDQCLGGRTVHNLLPPDGDTGHAIYLGPQNDDFARAEGLGGRGGVALGNTAGGTTEGSEPDHCTLDFDCSWIGDHSVWYAWTALVSGPATIDTCETQIDSILAVYTGNDLGSLIKVADDNNHDGGCGGAWPYGSKVTFAAVAGETYRIAVGDAGGARNGTFTLNVAGPANKAPIVTSVGPVAGSRIHDRTPRVKALVSDSVTDLAKTNIKLFVDGARKKRFSYNSATDKLVFQSKRLSFGRHTVAIRAKDSEALAVVKTWSFRIGP
jgi:hypothetical protein